MYPAAGVSALAPAASVTWTWSYPAISAGVVKLNELAVMPDGVTVVPPMVAVMPATNPLPVTVTTWPPVTGPADGVNALMLGGPPPNAVIPFGVPSPVGPSQPIPAVHKALPAQLPLDPVVTSF